MRDLIHIHQTAELAERVLLPGDPGRALRLAQTLLHEPKMLNHNRGLWGYTGLAAADGELLSIQSTGMGGPSMAIVASELIELGARRLLRIGTCGALEPSLGLGRLVLATEAICADGTSQALRAVAGCAATALGERVAAAAKPLQDLRAAGVQVAGGIVEGPVVSTDLFYDADELFGSWRAAGAIAVEMEAAALLSLAARRGVDAACALLVSNTLVGPAPAWIGEEALHEAERALGELAVGGLPA